MKAFILLLVLAGLVAVYLQSAGGPKLTTLINRETKNSVHGIMSIKSGAEVKVLGQYPSGRIKVSHGETSLSTPLANIKNPPKDIPLIPEEAAEVALAAKAPPLRPEPNANGIISGRFLVDQFVQGGAYGTLSVGDRSTPAFIYPFQLPLGVPVGTTLDVEVKDEKKDWILFDASRPDNPYAPKGPMFSPIRLTPLR